MDANFLNDQYLWYPLLGLLRTQLESIGARWALTGDVAAIVYGYANATPIQTMSAPLLDVYIEKEADANRQRIDVIKALRAVGFDINVQDLTFVHNVAGIQGTIAFRKIGMIRHLAYPVVELELLVQDKRDEWKRMSWDSVYTARVLGPQLEELMSIATTLP